MKRDEVLSYIRAHLADELELDPARIQEGTRFKADLEADSLDLYGLVQELEDNYGVKMSDEQAAQITTVGQAVDYVLAETSPQAISGDEASGRGRTSPQAISGERSDEASAGGEASGRDRKRAARGREASGRGRTSPATSDEASDRGATTDAEPRP